MYAFRKTLPSETSKFENITNKQKLQQKGSLGLTYGNPFSCKFSRGFSKAFFKLAIRIIKCFMVSAVGTMTYPPVTVKLYPTHSVERAYPGLLLRNGISPLPLFPPPHQSTKTTCNSPHLIDSHTFPTGSSLLC